LHLSLSPVLFFFLCNTLFGSIIGLFRSAGFAVFYFDVCVKRASFFPPLFCNVFLMFLLPFTMSSALPFCHRFRVCCLSKIPPHEAILFVVRPSFLTFDVSCLFLENIYNRLFCHLPFFQTVFCFSPSPPSFRPLVLQVEYIREGFTPVVMLISFALLFAGNSASLRISFSNFFCGGRSALGLVWRGFTPLFNHFLLYFFFFVRQLTPAIFFCFASFPENDSLFFFPRLFATFIPNDPRPFRLERTPFPQILCKFPSW